MSDLISRRAVIEIIKNYCENGCDYAEDNWCPSCQREKFVELLKALPSAQPEPHWIPCSERLPEEGEVVLTQAKFKDDVKMAVSSRIDYNYWTTWGTRDINIIAWMPLPEPYKGEQK